jgi:rhodanese-related sulfurtransferase
VRETNEVAAAHIPGAINIPLSQLKHRLTELDNYKNSEIITQCRTGRRSAEALKILTASGFTNVKTLKVKVDPIVQTNICLVKDRGLITLQLDGAVPILQK